MPYSVLRTGNQLTDRNLDSISQTVAAVAAKVATLYTGTGVPTFNPGSSALYIRQDGGAGTVGYTYYSGAWHAVF